MITFKSSTKFDKQANLMLLDKESVKQKKFNKYHTSLKEQLVSLYQSGQFNGEREEIFPILLKNRLILLVGIGSNKEISPTSLKKTFRKVILSPYLKKIKSIDIVPPNKEEWTIKAIIESILIGAYAWRKYLPKEEKEQIIRDKKFA